MASGISANQAEVMHFNLLNDNVLPKPSIDNKLHSTESSKSDEVVEDDVFTNESETNCLQIGKSQQSATSSAVNVATIDVQRGDSYTANVSRGSPNRDGSISLDASANVSTPAVAIPPTTTIAGSGTTSTSTTPTSRRPSYTSKAPSALTNLPKTIDEINDSPNTLQPFILSTGADLLEKDQILPPVILKMQD